jgi:hypothetical protein
MASPNYYQQLITLLDIKQRLATIEDARLTETQTTILIIFTLATVTFVSGKIVYVNDPILT